MRGCATDQDLWTQVRDDDEHAFALVFRRYHERILRLVSTQLSDVDGADPAAVAADVFHTAWRRRATVHVESTAWPWLRAVATRHCANERRRCVRQDRLARRAAHETTTGGGAQPDHALPVAERIMLADALSRLGPLERQVAQLALVDDLAHAEVAGLLRVPVGTVKSRLHRARRLLRRQLPDMLG